MSDSTTTSSPSINMEDLELGNKVVSYALNVLAWGCAVAVAMSCSTILMGIVMFIIMSIVMALLAALAQLFIFFKVDASSIESLGRNVGKATSRVTSLFARKVPA